MTPIPLFRDRQEAGQQLAQAVVAEMATLNQSELTAPPIVYALPKGGLPVALPLSQLLNCPLDVIVAKKVTRPDNPELAIGAVTADGHIIRSRQACFTRYNSSSWRSALEIAHDKATSQYAEFAPYCPKVDPNGAIALLVDDGIATGMTMAVAARALQAKLPAVVLICAPVAPQRLVRVLRHWCDRIVIW
ncbi:MAG: phosphoribosyltransferase, partial [Leptolyngbyaceae cyanobacterium SL_7_1]|nr:phosphoribosyltransferase [Leptolyngbyaceae cyanobacterium SL_7_1]